MEPTDQPDQPPGPPSANRGVPTGGIYSGGDPNYNPQPEAAEAQYHQPPEEPKTPEQKKSDSVRSVLTTAGLLLLAPLIAWSISTFALQSYQVDGQSMEQTLQNQDRLIINKVPRSWSRLTGHQYVPHRGDVIIFNLPPGGCNRPESEQLIKRVIGLPGERVVVKGSTTTVYNTATPQGFNPDKSGKYTPVSYNNLETTDVTLGSNEIFVMGDNRPNSCDSRYFGPVKVDSIVGRLELRIMPFNKWQSY